MIDKSVILVGVVTFAVALAAPHLKVPDGVGDANGTDASMTFSERSTPYRAATPRPVTAPANGAAEIARDDDSHFRADVTVNGRPLKMLVDSGASLVVLTEADARAVGLFLNPSDFTDSASTAGGTVKVAPVVIERLALGGIERRNVRAAVVPGALLSQSLLGQSFLGQLTEVSIRDDVMRLR